MSYNFFLKRISNHLYSGFSFLKDFAFDDFAEVRYACQYDINISSVRGTTLRFYISDFFNTVSITINKIEVQGVFKDNVLLQHYSGELHENHVADSEDLLEQQYEMRLEQACLFAERDLDEVKSPLLQNPNICCIRRPTRQ